jgi:hypothetical protein
MERYTKFGLWQLKKVTKFFAIVALCLLIAALGFAAKHGQFESPAHHGHFLSKSVKMEYASYSLDAAMNYDAIPVAMHLEVLFFLEPAAVIRSGIIPPKSLSLPLLV